MTVAEARKKWTDDRLDDLKEGVEADARDLKTEMNARFDKVDNRFETLEAKMDDRFDKVDKRFWQLVGGLGAGCVSIVVAIVGNIRL